MKLQIIETDQYWLAVSDEEIKEGDYGVGFATGIKGHGGRYFLFKHDGSVEAKLNVLAKAQKVINHLPLNDSPILEGVDLLPELGDIDIEYIVKDVCGYDKNTLLPINDSEVNTALECLKRYQVMCRYNEDDLRKAIDIGYKLARLNLYEADGSLQPKIEEYIQSLKQPRVPKFFIPETGKYEY